MASVEDLRRGIEQRESNLKSKEERIQEIKNDPNISEYRRQDSIKSLRKSIARDNQILREMRDDLRRKRGGKVTIQKQDPLRDTPEKADEYGARIKAGQTREDIIQQQEAIRQQEQFIKNNPYGYTSTSGELVGSSNPQALNQNSYIQKGDEIRQKRLEREGNFQTTDGRVYNVQGYTDPSKPQYRPPANFTTETGQEARVSYTQNKDPNKYGADRIEPYEPKRNGFGKVEDFLFKSQQVGKTPTAFQTGRASVGFLASTGYYTGKTLVYEVPRAILNPVDTIKGYWTLATSREARAQLGQSIGWTIQNNPGKASGTALGYILTGKAIKQGAKGVQAVDNVLKYNPKARYITYGALGTTAVVYALKNPADALINSGRVGMAVFVGKVRKSPISKVQKSKMARGQVTNPKYSKQGNTFIEKTGRANKGRNKLKVESLSRDKVGVVTSKGLKPVSRDLKVTQTQTRVSGRGANRVKTTDVTTSRFIKAQLKTMERTRSVDIGKGSSRTIGGKGYSRPPSQVQTPKGVGDRALVVIQRQQQTLKNFQARSTKPNIKQLPNKGQYYTGTRGAQVLREPKAVKLKFNKRTQSYRPVSKREARFQKYKEALRLKARRRSESKIKNNYGTFYNLKSFFENRKATSRGIARVRGQGQIKQATPRTTDKTLTKGEAQALASKIKAVDKRPQTDVEIIPPNTAKAVRGESVQRGGDFLNSQVGTASAVLTLRPLAERETSIQAQQPKARVEIINRQSPAQRVRPSQALVLNRAQAQAQAQRPALAQASASASRSTSQTPLIKQTTQNERRIATPPRSVPRPTPRPVRNAFRPQPPPIERILPKIPFRPPTPSPRQERGFNVLTRKGGNFIRANPLSLSRAEALNFGANLVKGTARASFKVVEAGEPARGRYKTSGSLLGLIKKAGGVFVEPREKRINTRGELEQITFKGQKARRSRRGLGVFGL